MITASILARVPPPDEAPAEEPSPEVPAEPAPPRGLVEVVAGAYVGVVRDWRQLLPVLVLVIVLTQVLAFVITAWLADGAIVNGRLVPTGPAQRWLEMSLQLTSGLSGVRVVVPLILLAGWVTAVVAGLAVAAGRPFPRTASWAGVALLIGMAAIAVLVGSALAAGFGGGFGAVVALVAGAVMLSRFVLALPAAILEKRGVLDAFGRALELSGGRSFRVALAVLAGVAGIPLLIGLGASAIDEPLGTLVMSLAMLVMVAGQALVLAHVYRWLAGEPPPVPAPPAGRRRAAGAVLAVVIPALVTGGYVWTNPERLAVASVSESPPWLIERPLATAELADGSPVIVTDMGIIQCRDDRCTDSASVSLPCVDGAPLRTTDGGGRGCSIEAPWSAATVRPDGTLIGLRRQTADRIRLVWCRLDGGPRCAWGGADTLKPRSIQTWPAVAVNTDGEVVVAIVGPGAAPDRGEVLLLTCTALPCVDPIVRRAGEVPVPGGQFGYAQIAVSVDPATGAVAIGHHDRVTGKVLLGGCAWSRCPDPTLHEVVSASDPTGPVPSHPAEGGTPSPAMVPDADAMNLVATASGPLLTIGRTVIRCADITCAGSSNYTADVNVLPLNGGLLVQAGVAHLTFMWPNGRSANVPVPPGTRLVTAAAMPGGRPYAFLSTSDALLTIRLE